MGNFCESSLQMGPNGPCWINRLRISYSPRRRDQTFPPYAADDDDGNNRLDSKRAGLDRALPPPLLIRMGEEGKSKVSSFRLWWWASRSRRADASPIRTLLAPPSCIGIRSRIIHARTTGIVVPFFLFFWRNNTPLLLGNEIKVKEA